MFSRPALFGGCLWAALASIPFSIPVAAQPVSAINLGPNQPLALTLDLSPNIADTLLFFDSAPLSASGVPTITGQLFNNGNLLGTFTQLQSGYFAMAFESLTTQYTSPPGPVSGILPTQVDFSSLNQGTTVGCLFVTVTGGSISFNPGTFVAYDALTSDNFAPLGGMSSQFYWTVPPSAPSIDAVLNAASYGGGGALVPGSIATVFGNFSQICPAEAESHPLPTRLSGLSMQFGNQAEAPLFYTSLQQVNLQIPWELATQSQTTLAAMLDGQSIAGQTVSVGPFWPGIFSTNSQGSGQGAILDSSYRLVDASNPATPGPLLS